MYIYIYIYTYTHISLPVMHGLRTRPEYINDTP